MLSGEIVAEAEWFKTLSLVGAHQAELTAVRIWDGWDCEDNVRGSQ